MRFLIATLAGLSLAACAAAAPPAYAVENKCPCQFSVVNKTPAVAAAAPQYATVCGPTGCRLVATGATAATAEAAPAAGTCASSSCGSAAAPRTRWHLFGRPHRR